MSLRPVADDVVILAGLVEPATLKTLDAIHLATAVMLREAIGCFVTYDRRARRGRCASAYPSSPRSKAPARVALAGPGREQEQDARVLDRADGSRLVRAELGDQAGTSAERSRRRRRRSRSRPSRPRARRARGRGAPASPRRREARSRSAVPRRRSPGPADDAARPPCRRRSRPSWTPIYRGSDEGLPRKKQCRLGLWPW